MTNSRSREHRSATTFWMNNELKEKAQLIASEMKITMTDLLNKSVEIYLNEGHRWDDQYATKIAIKELGKELKSNEKYETQLTEALQFQKGLVARIEHLENQIIEFSTGTALQSSVHTYIQAHIEEKVEPIMKAIESMIRGLAITTSEEQSITELEDQIAESP